MKFRKFSSFIALLWISLLFFVVLSVPGKMSAQVPLPTFVCLGDCPAISPNPTSANQIPIPSAANTAQAQATAAPAQIVATPAPTGNYLPNGQPCQPVTAVHSAQERKFKHARKRNSKSSSIDAGILQKLIKLIEQLITLITQIIGGNIPLAQNQPANQANMQNQAVNTPIPQAAGNNAQTAGNNPQVTLPPCPTNAPPVNQTTQQGQTQPAVNQPAQVDLTPASQGANIQPTAGANVAQGAQCNVQPPPGAQAAGLTKLVFCEDFSDPSHIDFDNQPVAGTTTFVGMRPGNIFSAQTEVRSDFTWTPEGTLISKSQHDNYQADFISTWPTGGGNHAGYDTGAKPFYTEASVKHNQWNSGGARGFFAFWAMDTCHLYNTGCSQFYEPDFYEFISIMHVNAFHWWNSSMAKVDSSCINTKSAGITPEGKDTQFNIYGAQFTNEGTNYYYNDKANITGACPDKAWSKTIPQGPQPDKTDKYPIIIGSGPNQPYEVDYVRVWQAP